jgi:hypothetical protein
LILYLKAEFPEIKTEQQTARQVAIAINPTNKFKHGNTENHAKGGGALGTNRVTQRIFIKIRKEF